MLLVMTRDTVLDPAFLLSILESLPDPVFILDEDGRYLAVLGGGERSRYDSTSYLIGKRLHDVLPAARADGFLAELRGVLESGRMHVHEYTLSAPEIEGNPQDGPRGPQWFQGRIARVGRLSPDGKPCVAWVVVNISERKRLEAELERLAHRDELTGLHNRRSFLQVAHAWMAEESAAGRDHRLHLAMIDLDHFKAVNDRYGHLIGDAVLQHLARALRQGLGPNAEAGRVGGEEFAALFRDQSLDDAVAALTGLQHHLKASPLRIGSEAIEARFSAGVVSMVLGDRVPGDLMRRADQLLYEAKDAGRDRVAFPGWIDRRQR